MADWPFNPWCICDADDKVEAQTIVFTYDGTGETPSRGTFTLTLTRAAWINAYNEGTAISADSFLAMHFTPASDDPNAQVWLFGRDGTPTLSTIQIGPINPVILPTPAFEINGTTTAGWNVYIAGGPSSGPSPIMTWGIFVDDGGSQASEGDIVVDIDRISFLTRPGGAVDIGGTVTLNDAYTPFGATTETFTVAVS